MLDLGLRIVVETLFSLKIGGTAPQLTTVMAGLLDHVVARSRRLGYPPPWLPVSENRRFAERLQEIDRFSNTLISERKHAASERDDLLEHLLKGETGTPLAPRQVRDEIVTMLIAGHETVATALAWTWFLLAGAPEVRAEAEREVTAALSSGRGSGVELPRLPLCSAIFSETLRLYPPAWLISRRTVNSDDVAGCHVPAGSLVVLSPYVTHRNPAYWPNPNRFDPTRFLAPTGDRPRYTYFPFGGGPRMCIGSSFAAVEAQIVMAGILPHYRLEPVSTAPVDVEAAVTLRPRHGLPMRLQRLSPA
jgi:cytochrome P450